MRTKSYQVQSLAHLKPKIKPKILTREIGQNQLNRQKHRNMIQSWDFIKAIEIMLS